MTPLERLKIQFNEAKKETSNIESVIKFSAYTGMRNLCIDCGLLIFLEIEEMENEIGKL